MMEKENGFREAILADQLEKDIRALSEDLTVGNYFERIGIINEKKAILEKLKRHL